MTADHNSANFTPLCFDRADFNRQDFNVEKFLLKARRRGNSFEEIRDDLRVFLKIIQNSMIELINKDYADFVHLSANLAGLRGAVEKLNTEMTDLVTGFDEISTKIQQSVDVLSTKFDEKIKITVEQQNLHTKISACNKLNQLKLMLNWPKVSKNVDILDRINYQITDLKALSVTRNEQLDAEFNKTFNDVVDRYQKLLESLFVLEINAQKSQTTRSFGSKSKESVSKILTSFYACDRLDSAHAIFLSEFVESELRTVFASKKFSDKTSQLNDILNLLVGMRKKYAGIFVTCIDSNVQTFLSDCLLTALLSCLDDRFGNLLFPTDPSVFRKAYCMLMKFFEQWINDCALDKLVSPPYSVGLVRMIFNKFNISVYFQLRKQEILTNLDKAFETRHRPSDDDKTSGFSLHCSWTVYNNVKLIWSDDDNGVYLPPLTSKCFELMFVCLNRFDHFLSDINRDYSSASRTVADLTSSINGSAVEQKSTTNLHNNAQQTTDPDVLVRVAGDVFVLEKLVDNFFKTDVVMKLKCDNNNSDAVSSDADRLQVFIQCLTDTFHKLRLRVDHLVYETLRDVLVQKVSSQMSTVGEIPRQYRWTRKEAPSQASKYVSNGLQALSEFLSSSINRLPEEYTTKLMSYVLEKVVQSYSADIKSVIDSVDKISSSLNKLKKGGKSFSSGITDAGGIGAATDDEKIRMQLSLDVKEFSKLVGNLQLPKDICDTTVLEELVSAKSYCNE